MHARVRVRLSSAGASVSATVDEDTPPPDPGPSMRKSCIYRFYKIYYTIDAGEGGGGWRFGCLARTRASSSTHGPHYLQCAGVQRAGAYVAPIPRRPLLFCQ